MRWLLPIRVNMDDITDTRPIQVVPVERKPRRDQAADTDLTRCGEVRILTPDFGGGVEISPYAEELLFGAITKKSGRSRGWCEMNSDR